MWKEEFIMIKLSQVVETKIKENSKKSLEEKKKLEEERLKEEKEFVIQLRRQQRQEKIRYFLNPKKDTNIALGDLWKISLMFSQLSFYPLLQDFYEL